MAKTTICATVMPASCRNSNLMSNDVIFHHKIKNFLVPVVSRRFTEHENYDFDKLLLLHSVHHYSNNKEKKKKRRKKINKMRKEICSYRVSPFMCADSEFLSVCVCMA